MAATRLFCCSRPLNNVLLPSSSSSSCTSSWFRTLRSLSRAELSGGKMVRKDAERKSTVAMKAAAAASEPVTTAEPQVGPGIDMAALIENLTSSVVKASKAAVKARPLKLNVQRIIERVIIDCRLFTIFAVAGSLLGSVLCFMEGCFLVIESYFQYFNNLSQKSDEGDIVHLLIEAIDMFLVGTAMLIFGVGLYVMFVGSRKMKDKPAWLPGSNFFGLFHLKTFPSWVPTESVSQAKSKIGHAVMMILQVGVLDKFKSVPLVTSLDLACFAGAVLVSSACIFLLSRLSSDGSILGDR